MTDLPKENDTPALSAEEEKRLARRAKKDAAAVASKEHYARMVHAGFKKFGIFLKVDKMRKLAAIAKARDVPLYQLIDEVFERYLDALKKSD